MCKFKSGIILKDRIYIPDINSHTEMLEKLGIEDSKENAERFFVRAELVPPNKDYFAQIDSWKYIVDQDILPDWYIAEVDELRMRNAVKEWAKYHIHVRKKELILTEGIHYVLDSEVTARDSSEVTARGSSKVTAYDSSEVTAYDSSEVTACGRSKVTAYGSSEVTAYGSSEVAAYDSSEVTARGSSKVTAYDSSEVTAYGSSEVTAYGSSKVTAYDSSEVTAYGSSEVTARDSSRIFIEFLSSFTFENCTLLNNAIAIDWRQNQVICRNDAKWKLIKKEGLENVCMQ